MIEDTRVDSNRLLALEAKWDELSSKNDATYRLMQDILQRLGPAQAENVQNSIPRPDSRQPSPVPTPSAGRKRNFLKPSAPPEFAGDRSAGKEFLNSCRTYIRLCPDAFEDETTQIVWAMSYMKTGRAARWAAREFEQEAQEGRF